MPPLPAWFAGRRDIGRFLAERAFATPWRLLPTRANGQLAFACYQGGPDGRFRRPARDEFTATAAGSARRRPGRHHGDGHRRRARQTSSHGQRRAHSAVTNP